MSKRVVICGGPTDGPLREMIARLACEQNLNVTFTGTDRVNALDEVVTPSQDELDKMILSCAKDFEDEYIPGLDRKHRGKHHGKHAGAFGKSKR